MIITTSQQAEAAIVTLPTPHLLVLSPPHTHSDYPRYAGGLGEAGFILDGRILLQFIIRLIVIINHQHPSFPFHHHLSFYYDNRANVQARTS